jgi:hypothetical protein
MANERPRRRRRTVNERGDDGGKSEQEATLQPIPEQTGPDLNSKSATHVADIVFRRPQQYNFPVIQFECHECLATCQQIRESLQACPADVRPLVRIEDQKLNLIGPHTKGQVLLFESAAMLDGDQRAPVSVFSLYIPGDKYIRWFWTLMSPVGLLADLTKRNLVGPAEEIPYYDNPPKRSKTGVVLASRHHMLYTFVAQSFRIVTTFPESSEYLTASQISDVCPSIVEPKTAHQRIEAENDLHVSHDVSIDGKDLSDDRYLLELHLAERALVSLVGTCCAEYLLIKRQYFRAFSRDTILQAEKVRRAAAQNQNQQRKITPATPAPEAAHDDNDEDDEQSQADTPNSNSRATRSRARSNSAPLARPVNHQGARARAAQIGARNRALRVRTRNAHIRAVEAQSGWNFARAKKLVRGWEILGFLDEERVLAVFEGEDDGGETDEE